MMMRDKGVAFNLLNTDLMKEVREVDNRVIGNKTGFTQFDYPTSSRDIDGDTGFILPNGGPYPRIHSFIGESGAGKSTIVLQIAGGIVDSFPGSTLVDIDPEGNTSPRRIMDVCHWGEQEYKNKCILVDNKEPISILTVYNHIRRIAFIKEKNKKKLLVDTPYTDMYTGKKIQIYPPTVVVLDSVPALSLLKDEEETVEGKREFKELEKMVENIAGMHEGRDNTSFLKKVSSFLAKYNIILFAINHLSKDTPMSRFDIPKKYHPNLKAGEKLKGGKEWIFQSHSFYRLDISSPIDDRNPDYGDKIRGNYVRLTLIKNKGNVSKTTFTIVFDTRTGLRPELSDFQFLFENKIGWSGSPMSMRLDILPEISFTRKTLYGKCQQHPELSRAISYTVKSILAEKLITLGEEPMLDLEALSNLPLEERLAIIYSGTIPYSGFYDGGWEYVERMVESLKKASMGRDTTGIPGDTYISPANSGYINDIARDINDGYTRSYNLDKDDVHISDDGWVDPIDNPSFR